MKDRKKNTSSDGKKIVPAAQWIPDKLFQEIQKNVPVACVDILPVRKSGKNKIEVLLIKRKIYPEEGKWGLLGGRILKGERTREAITRQANKEFGVSVKIVPPWTEENPFVVFNDPVSDKQKHYVVLTYLVKITGGKINKSGPEFSEARWFTLDKLPTKFSFHHKKVLKMLADYIAVNSLKM